MTPTLKTLLADFLDAIDDVRDLGEQLRERLVPADEKPNLPISEFAIKAAERLREHAKQVAAPPVQPRVIRQKPKFKTVRSNKSQQRIAADLLCEILADNRRHSLHGEIFPKLAPYGISLDTIGIVRRLQKIKHVRTGIGKTSDSQLWFGADSHREPKGLADLVTPQLIKRVRMLAKDHNHKEIAELVGVAVGAIPRILGDE